MKSERVRHFIFVLLDCLVWCLQNCRFREWTGQTQQGAETGWARLLSWCKSPPASTHPLLAVLYFQLGQRQDKSSFVASSLLNWLIPVMLDTLWSLIFQNKSFAKQTSHFSIRFVKLKNITLANFRPTIGGKQLFCFLFLFCLVL